MVLLFLLLTAFASAETRDIEVFRTCHRQFTRQVVDPADPLFQRVKAGEQDGVSACLDLLAGFSVDKKGNLVPAKGEKSLAVLNSFHDLHASWFFKKSYTYFSNQCQLKSLQELQDVTAPALYFDFALFDDKNKDITYAVKSRDGLFPLRSVKENKNAYFANNQELLAFGEGKEFFGRKFFGFEGRLLGIAKEGPEVWVKNLAPLAEAEGPKRAQLYRSLGPGFMGHPSYFLRSTLRAPGLVFKKSVPPLILAMDLARDLFCLEFPSLHEHDVLTHVEKNSRLTFKRDPKCMNCHSTIHPLSLTFRNFALLHSSDQCVTGQEQNVIAVYKFPEKDFSPEAANKNFHQSKSEGGLQFRDFEDRLVSLNHSSLEEMVENVANNPQFYYCSAKRYFQFLTGIDPNLNHGKRAAANQLLKRLTYDYMEHKKPKRVIEQILRSEFY